MTQLRLHQKLKKCAVTSESSQMSGTSKAKNSRRRKNRKSSSEGTKDYRAHRLYSLLTLSEILKNNKASLTNFNQRRSQPSLFYESLSCDKVTTGHLSTKSKAHGEVSAILCCHEQTSLILGKATDLASLFNL